MDTGKHKRRVVHDPSSSVLTADIIRGQKRAGTNPVVAAPQTWGISRVSITMRSNS